MIGQPLPPGGERRRLLEEALAAVNTALEIGPPSEALWFDAANVRVRALTGGTENLTGRNRAAIDAATEATIEAARHGASLEKLAALLHQLPDLRDKPEFQAALRDPLPTRPAEASVVLADPTRDSH
jgi:hypothetical protein